jgi:hypothetical protein
MMQAGCSRSSQAARARRFAADLARDTLVGYRQLWEHLSGGRFGLLQRSGQFSRRDIWRGGN